jgi:hypothetical protein
LCYFPVTIDNGWGVLTTCETARAVNWNVALQRGYTLAPKPLVVTSTPVRPVPFGAIVGRAWRSRRQHRGFVAAVFAERASALDEVRRETERREAEADQAREDWIARRDHAYWAFRERHQ